MLEQVAVTQAVGFKPSKVSYKQVFAMSEKTENPSFKPSKVSYKHVVQFKIELEFPMFQTL